jgi:hypothetical protein
LQDYNGVDVNQIADYIELSAEGCIDRVLQSHSWDSSSPKESVDDKTAPLPTDAVDRLYKSPSGPKEGTEEHAVLSD